MNLQEIIRNVIEDQLIEEDKTSMIKKLVNLSSEQKKDVRDFLIEYPQFEREWDWNQYRTLKPEDFIWKIIELKNTISPLAALKKLKKNKDYIEVKGISAPGLLGVFMPLTWDAAQLIASKKIGGTRGYWCIAHSEHSYFWKSYKNGTGEVPHWADVPAVFMMFIFENDKYCLQIQNKYGKYNHDDKYGGLVWDRDDDMFDSPDKIPGINVTKVISKTEKLIDEVIIVDDKIKLINKDDEIKMITAITKSSDRRTPNVMDNLRMSKIQKVSTEKLIGLKFDKSFRMNHTIFDIDLSSIMFDEVSMIGTKFGGPNFECNRLSFYDCDLTDVNLSSKKITRTAFHSCNLSYSDFEDSILDDCHFYGKDSATEIQARNAVFNNVDFFRSTLKYSIFYNTTFTELSMYNNMVQDCTFSMATFEKECKFEGMRATDVNFLGATFNDESEFRRCKFTNCNFKSVKFNNIDFIDCIFVNCGWDDSTFNNVSFIDGEFDEPIDKTKINNYNNITFLS